MDFIIERLPVQSIAYMRRTGAYGSENYQLMASLKEWASKKGLLEDCIIYGIAHDNEKTPPEQCRYDVCLTTTADFLPDESVQRGELQSGTYAIFIIPHTAEAVQGFWESLLDVMNKNDLRLDSSRPIMERYDYRLVENGKCEFCVPI